MINSNIAHPYYYSCKDGHVVAVNGSIHRRLQSGITIGVQDHGELDADAWLPDGKPSGK